MSLENLDHDRAEREVLEELNKPRPLSDRFNTNPNIRDAWRREREERKNKDKEGSK